MQTLLLSRTDVESLLNPLELYPALKSAFGEYSLNRNIPSQRARSILPYENTSAMILFPGISSNIPAYTVKVHAKFPSQPPSIKGVINLHDIESGQLLAIMDSTYITAVRTGLSGAIGTHLLARKDAKKIAIIGAGVQSKLQLQSLQYFRQISSVFVYDTDIEKARSFVQEMKEEYKTPIVVCNSLAVAVNDADIVISATWSREPFLFSKMLKKGVHITTLGPDEPGKCEVSAELIQKAIFVCDDRQLAVQMGAIGGVGLSEENIHAEIDEVILNQRLGRTNDNQITIYGSVGLAFQDLVAAWYVYQKARELNKGQHINFLE
ncbi:ornithine cyclodeaminase [Bacillus oleivorans]|uniref:Ornithine cyclodeaminase n=1 Tax=Bacillus oleivorans TaxID=1448271 RepID=A0A285CJ85_9BACI|nr:ornithine cyclodeaminase family protein [Bacillus oleivorans]SNX67066.1 ornithine cyclodeaminase [Bacillus oleivorans]